MGINKGRIRVAFMIFLLTRDTPLHSQTGLTAAHEALGGAGSASAVDGSALLLNPAGISQRNRYTIAGVYGYASGVRILGASAIDTTTSPLGLGVYYFFERGEKKEERRHVLRLALAEFYFERIYIGLGYRHHWFWDQGFGEYRDFPAFGIGIILPLRYFNLGVSGIDLLPRRDPYLDPRVLLGISVPLAPFDSLSLILAFDGIRHEFSRSWELRGGGDLLLFKLLSLRGGYRLNLNSPHRTFHMGLGVKVSSLSLDYALTRFAMASYKHTFTFEFALF